MSSLRTGRVTFSLSKVNCDEKIFNIDGLVRSGRICSPLEPVNIDKNRCKHLKDLEIADEFPRSDAEVDILIGVNHYLKQVSGTIIRHPSDDTVPAAMETVFGHIIIGEDDCGVAKSRMNGNVGCMFVQSRSQTALESQVERFWKLNSIGMIDQSRIRTKEERDAEISFQESHTFTDDRYCVKLPFKDDAPELSSNFDFAEKMMYATENRLKKDKVSMENYENAMQDYEKLGFARHFHPKKIQIPSNFTRSLLEEMDEGSVTNSTS